MPYRKLARVPARTDVLKTGETTAPVAIPISVKIPEAVRLSGISRSRLYELMKSGDVRFAKVGTSTVIIVESLRQFVLSRCVLKDAAGARP